MAAHTVTTAVRTLTGEPDLAVGIVACLQTGGSLANWHPHLHLLVTDGGFRPDGAFISWPAHDTAALTEAFRRAVLRPFVRREFFEAHEAQAMLAWPHSGFHVHDAVLVPEDDTAFTLLRAPAGALLCTQPGGVGTAGLRRHGESGDVPLRQGGGADRRERDAGPAGVPGAADDAHP